MHVLPSGRFVVAVADGLGSAKLSHIGSRLAVDTAIEAAAPVLENYRLDFALVTSSDPGIATTQPPTLEDAAREALTLGFEAARSAILDKAKIDGIEPRDLATTLILAAGRLGGTVVVAHLGDGAVVARQDVLTLASRGTETEYANETTPITGTQWREQVLWTTLRKPRAIALFTDGIQRRVLEPSPEGKGTRPVARFFEPIFDAVAKMESDEEARSQFEQLLQTDKMDDPTGDDKTLVVVTQ